jgi:hypothetical protein
MTGPIVTRGFTFTVPLVTTGGYLSAIPAAFQPFVRFFKTVSIFSQSVKTISIFREYVKSISIGKDF